MPKSPTCWGSKQTVQVSFPFDKSSMSKQVSFNVSKMLRDVGGGALPFALFSRMELAMAWRICSLSKFWAMLANELAMPPKKLLALPPGGAVLDLE